MKKFLISLVLILVVLISLMSTPLFNIQGINVYGNTSVSDNQVRGYIPFGNIFTFSARSAREQLLQNPYVYRMTSSRNFLTREININIIEREKIGYVHFSENHYLAIDREGRVLEVLEQRSSTLPEITGLNFPPFRLGELLEVEAPHIFNTISYLTSLFITYQTPSDIAIDISAGQQIMLNYGLISINLGTNDELDEKIRTMLSILPSIENFKNIGGTLDISNLEGQWFFSLPL